MAMSELVELHELDLSLIHHFATENNLSGLKEILLQQPETINKQNEVSLFSGAMSFKSMKYTHQPTMLSSR